MKKTKQSPKKPKSLIHLGKSLYLLGFAVLIISILSWLILARYNDAKFKKNFLFNNNDVVCVTSKDIKSLDCEDTGSGTTKKIELPSKFHNSSISASPDGTKLLFETFESGVFITDLDFSKEKEVISAKDQKDRFYSFTWTSGSEGLLIREIRREQNDADFLPEPMVVSLYDTSSGESKTVYKTGERQDIDDFQVLGGDGKYIYISVPTPKNWVADSVAPPTNTIQAINIEDGSVTPVSMYHVLQGGDFEPSLITYDSSRKLFTLQDSIPKGDTHVAKIRIANIVFGEVGPALTSIFQMTADDENTYIHQSITKRGIVTIKDSELILVDSLGNERPISLRGDIFNNTIFSLRSMPGL